MRNNQLLFDNFYLVNRLLLKIILQMPERKVWTPEEDRILKFLIQDRGLSRWSQISRVMEEEFQVVGRNGKQCRQRYHNHLDRNINNSEWVREEEQLLFTLQDEIGNKWALISGRLQGRTDNCVKNHFYSKLRKSLRSLNKKIHKFMKREYREIKTTTLYKIIETLQNRNKQQQTIQNQTFDLCKKIKNELWNYQNQEDSSQDPQAQLQLARQIIQSIALFDKEVKKNPRKVSLKSSAKISQKDSCLKPPSLFSSTRSIPDDSSDTYSNNSQLFSSSSFDHRSLQGNQQLLQPNKVFRSQKMQFESDESQQIDTKGKVLWKSVNFPKPSELMPEIKEIKHQSMKRENSSGSDDCKEARSGGQGSDYDSNHLLGNPRDPGMFDEESLEMRVCSPQGLTIEEKIEIHEESNDANFYGNMEMSVESELIKDFSLMSLTTIPKLGKYIF